MVTLKKIRTQHGVAMGKKKVRNRRIADEGLQDFPLGFTKSYKNQLCFLKSCSSKAQQQTASSRAAHAKIFNHSHPQATK